MAGNFLWVTKTEENIRFYSDSAKKSNLSIHFAYAIDPDTKKSICKFVRYLRKEFFFPIRCNVYFFDCEKFHSKRGGYCYGIFFSNEESGGRIYPQIYIPSNMELYFVYRSLCHELTHYFQWYFLDDNKSDRSLEIQAGNYAARIMEDYCRYHCTEDDSTCDSCYGK